MTIHLDLATILIAVASSAVSIFATWYFSKRHYSRSPSPLPVTENDIALQDNQNVFHFFVICVVAFVILMTVLVFACDPTTLRNQQTTQEITAQGGGGVAPDGPEALPALWEGRMVMGWTAHDQRATH